MNSKATDVAKQMCFRTKHRDALPGWGVEASCLESWLQSIHETGVLIQPGAGHLPSAGRGPTGQEHVMTVWGPPPHATLLSEAVDTRRSNS